MAKRVDGSLGTQLQGVSQQPAKERIAGQVEQLTNMTSDVVRMLHRRPPSNFINSLEIGPSIDVKKAFTHFYSRGDGEQYFIIILPGGAIHIADAAGNAQMPNVTTAFTDYVTSVNPKLDLRMTTVGDYTFVVNSAITVELDDSVLTPDSATTGSRVDVVAGQYSREYEITASIDGVETSWSHTTADSSTVANEKKIATDFIANKLFTTVPTAVTDDFDVFNTGSHLLFSPKSALTTYSFSTQDGTGGGAMKARNANSVSVPSDLPPRATHGEVYLIEGGAEAADDFYMIFESTDDSSTNQFALGKWVESVKPAIPANFDFETMPHMIVRTSVTNEFDCGMSGETPGTLELDSWAERTVGDEETNKGPDFLGSTFADITSFQDRLVLVDVEAVNLSVTTDFFNFWKKTVTTQLPDGPISISSASGQVNILRFAEQHDKDLIVFADLVQFTLVGTVAITPQNATMVETTKFQIQSGVAPAPSGQNMFFALNTGAYTGIREFYTDSTFDSNNARPITVAVERYIEGAAHQLVSATNISKLGVIAGPDNIFYLYEYLWDEQEKVQNSWGTWIFRDDMVIIHGEFLDDTLILIGYVGTELHFLEIPIHQDVRTSGSGGGTTDVTFESDIHLDHRTEETVAVDTITGLDHLPADIDKLDAIQGEGCPYPGMRAKIKTWDGSTAVFTSDMEGGNVWIGAKFMSDIIPTMPYIRDEGNRPIGTSDLIVGDMIINYGTSGDFNVDVIAEYSYTERNPGRILGQVSATLGKFFLTSGSFPVPVRDNNDRAKIRIYSDSPYPFTVQDIEWEGLYHKRGQRMSRNN